MPRIWISHYQIIAVTIETKGDNVYSHNKGGLDFGVRVSYHTNKNNTDVEKVVEPSNRRKRSRSYTK